MKALAAQVQHYFVKGKTVQWGRESKKLINVWLCYTFNQEKKRPYRAVRAAEPGNAGDLAAIYRARLEQDPASLKFLDNRFMLRFPNTGECPCIDGKDRGILDAPNHVEEANVGMYLNSTKNIMNVADKPCNCGRDWYPPWTSYGSDKSLESVESFDKRRMGLVLLFQVKVYDELVYHYDWSKTERECRPNDVLRTLSNSGGRR
jgi:hypothetical protein